MIGEVLQRCRDLVASGWCRDADARDASGREVDPSSAEAREWSVLGALARVAGARATLFEVERAVVSFGRVTGTRSLRAWNDARGRTQVQVVAAFDQALASRSETA
jgi:hypothetical protein